MLITVLLSESAQLGNTNAILPMTTVPSAGAYLPSTPMALGPNLLLDGHAPYNLCFSDLRQLLSLYQAEVLSTGTHVNGGGQKVLFPKEHNKVG